VEFDPYDNEFHALLRSMHMVIRGDALEWQKWQREGI
jgi:hypothetical protein